MYLVDANILITANNAHYGMDFAPGFWDWLDEAHENGEVFSIARVKDELLDPDLSAWASTRPDFFRAVDADASAALAKLAAWAAGHHQYVASAKSTFLASADYYLVAQASALGATVVTHEVAAPNATKKIKIPEACGALQVPFCQPWKMLREAGANLVY